MNHLAHCFLTFSHEEIMIGNFLTDLLTKNEQDAYSGQILKGIHLHRMIDSYTDVHPASLRLRTLLRPRHRKYAPVVVDLVWDYYLSQNWENYASVSLRQFAIRTYSTIAAYKDIMPHRIHNNIDMMIGDDFLLAYANERRMSRSLRWMDKRTIFPSNFTSASLDIENHDVEIQQLFHDFFQDIQDYIDRKLQEL